MTSIHSGPRLAQGASRVALGCSAAVLDAQDSRILLCRRSDNLLWGLPGGHVEPGETVAEACQREVEEETGLQVLPSRIIGVYSSPDFLVEYPDGNIFHVIAVHFAAKLIGGDLRQSDETQDFNYFSLAEASNLDELFEFHRQRVLDSFDPAAPSMIR